MEEKNLLKWVNGYGFQILRQVRLHGPSRKNGSCTPHQLPPSICVTVFSPFFFFFREEKPSENYRACIRACLAGAKKEK
jgi:hypothetical protein